MPRNARRKSESGIYHIMLRGINRQQIFEDEEDRKHFLETLARYKAQCGYQVYAYCLMGNHIHLLLKEGTEELALVIKRIAGSYAYWYNWKYCRCGHLFQDRFRSEPVEDDGYFLTVLRYIHQNPVKAQFCTKAEDYAYSSMREYLTAPVLADTGFALSMLPLDQFVEFHAQESEEGVLEMEERTRLTDEAATALILRISKCKKMDEFRLLDRATRNSCIHKLHDKGVSIRQISRLTGLSKKMIGSHIW